jgi:DNA-binding CsgD family transcriptional regulator
MGNDKIGTRLYISEKTVKNHLTHVFAKLRVSGRQQAVGRFLGGNKSTRRE